MKCVARRRRQVNAVDVCFALIQKQTHGKLICKAAAAVHSQSRWSPSSSRRHRQSMPPTVPFSGNYQIYSVPTIDTDPAKQPEETFAIPLNCSRNVSILRLDNGSIMRHKWPTERSPGSLMELRQVEVERRNPFVRIKQNPPLRNYFGQNNELEGWPLLWIRVTTGRGERNSIIILAKVGGRFRSRERTWSSLQRATKWHSQPRFQGQIVIVFPAEIFQLERTWRMWPNCELEWTE